MNGKAAKRPMDWRRLGLLLVLQGAAFFIFLHGAGSYGLWPPWEPKYPHTAAEMLARGDLLIPYYEGAPRWTKPPLHYWSLMPGIAWGGPTPLMARLPSIIAATLCVLALFLFLERLFKRRTAFIAALTLITIPQFAFMARQAMPDMLLTLWLTGAMGFLAMARFGGQAWARKGLWLFYLCIGLAVLTKGPLGMAIPAGAVLLEGILGLPPGPTLTLRGAWSGFWRWVAGHRVLSGAVIILAVAGPWFGLMALNHGEEFLGHLQFENIQRFREAVREHPGGAAFYLTVLMRGMFPWSLLLLAVGPILFFSRVDPEIGAEADTAAEAPRQVCFFLAWFLAPLLILSSAGTKLPHYLLPAAPPLAVLTALIWRRWLAEAARTPWLGRAFLVSALLLIIPFRDFNLEEGTRFLFANFSINDRPIDGVPELTAYLALFPWFWGGAMVWAYRRPGATAALGLALGLAFVNVAYDVHRLLPGQMERYSITRQAQLYEAIRQPDSELIFVGRAAAAHRLDLQFNQSGPVRVFATTQRSALMRALREAIHPALIVWEENLVWLRTELELYGLWRGVRLIRDPRSGYVLLSWPRQAHPFDEPGALSPADPGASSPADPTPTPPREGADAS